MAMKDEPVARAEEKGMEWDEPKEMMNCRATASAWWKEKSGRPHSPGWMAAATKEPTIKHTTHRLKADARKSERGHSRGPRALTAASVPETPGPRPPAWLGATRPPGIASPRSRALCLSFRSFKILSCSKSLHHDWENLSAEP